MSQNNTKLRKYISQACSRKSYENTFHKRVPEKESDNVARSRDTELCQYLKFSAAYILKENSKKCGHISVCWQYKYSLFSFSSYRVALIMQRFVVKQAFITYHKPIAVFRSITYLLTYLLHGAESFLRS